MSFLLFATVLSTQIPEAAIDHTWGQLMRARHHAGAWSVEVGSHRLAGDWIIVEADEKHAYTPRGGHGRRIHLVSSSSASYCSILPDEHRMHCEITTRSNELYNLHVPAGVDLTTGTHAVDNYVCKNGSCVRRRAGTLVSKTRARTPTLVEAQRLFGRLHQQSIVQALGATLLPRPGLVLRVPYRIVNPIQRIDRRFEQEVIEAEATVELTTSPKPVIVTREVARYVEDCEYSTQAASSCHPQPPTCKRR